MAWLEQRILGNLVKSNPRQWTWLKDVSAITSGVFWKFAGFAPLAGHRKHATSEVLHITRIGAMQVYDCGECVQISIGYALKDGVPKSLVTAATQGGAALPDPLRLAYDYGRAVAGNAADVNDVIAAAKDRFGEAVAAEMALTVATSAVFPIAKRGLGLATACRIPKIAA